MPVGSKNSRQGIIALGTMKGHDDVQEWELAEFCPELPTNQYNCQNSGCKALISGNLLTDRSDVTLCSKRRD